MSTPCERCGGPTATVAWCGCAEAELREQIANLRSELAEVDEALFAWIVQRNSLSSDCQALGIGPSDGGKWGQELAKRCAPLRLFCEGRFLRAK